jgi:hypothetical protein
MIEMRVQTRMIHAVQEREGVVAVNMLTEKCWSEREWRGRADATGEGRGRERKSGKRSGN